MRNPIERDGAADYIGISTQSLLPEVLSYQSDICAFFFFGQKCAAAYRGNAQHIEVIRCRRTGLSLKRITNSGDSNRDRILCGQRGERYMSLAVMHEARC